MILGNSVVWFSGSVNSTVGSADLDNSCSCTGSFDVFSQSRVLVQGHLDLYILYGSDRLRQAFTDAFTNDSTALRT